MAAVFVIFILQTNATSNYNYQSELEDISSAVSETYAKYILTDPDFTKAIENMKESYPYQIAIANNDQLIYGDFLTQEQFLKLIKSAKSPVSLDGTRYFYVLSPVKTFMPESDLTILIAKDIPVINEQLKRVLLFSGVSIFLISVSSITLLLFMFKRSIKQITDISRVAEEIKDGEFNYRIPVKSKDEIGRLAMSLNEMSAQLKQNESDREVFLASVSHELRTPLTILKTNTKGIIDGVIPPDQINRYLMSN